MARKKRKKGHARRGRKGKALRRRYGHSTGPGGSIRMNVSGQLVLDPEQIEEAIMEIVEDTVPQVVEESVEEAVEETVPDAIEDAIPAEFQ
jgi:hypothetical protein